MDRRRSASAEAGRCRRISGRHGDRASFLNNTEAEVHLLVVGERRKPENRIFYPLHPDRRPLHEDWWDGHPTHTLGAHDGMPDLVRAAKARREAD